MKLELIQPLAQALLEQLSSACLRIEIAGSVRRAKPEPQDLELVAIPALGESAERDLFGTIARVHTLNHLEEAIGTLLGLGEWQFDPVTRRNGARYKRLRHAASGVCCDLFITDARRWGVIYTIRTGPGDFSRSLVSYARRQGMFVQDGLLHRHPACLDEHGEVEPCPDGARCPRIVATPEEADVFRALGLPWIEPRRRNANLFYASIPRGMLR